MKSFLLNTEWKSPKELVQWAEEYAKGRPADIRAGQYIYTQLYPEFRWAADALGEFDCFYDDTKLPAFLEHLFTLTSHIEKVMPIVARELASVVAFTPTVGFSKTDRLLYEAARTVVSRQQCSASFLQRSLGVGHSRALHLMDQLELFGIIGPKNGNIPREVLVSNTEDLSIKMYLRAKNSR